MLRVEDLVKVSLKELAGRELFTQAPEAPCYLEFRVYSCWNFFEKLHQSFKIKHSVANT